MRNADKEINAILAIADSCPTKRQKRGQKIQKTLNWLLLFCIIGIIGCCVLGFSIGLIAMAIDALFGLSK